MNTTYTAWATTAQSLPGADPGIGITDDGGLIDGQWSVTDWEDWDADAADDELARMGWTRTGAWTDSAGQWAAEVAKA